MTPSLPQTRVTTAVLFGSIVGFCLFQARDLVTAWQHAPLERYSVFLFLLWLFPLRSSGGKASAFTRTPLLFIGLSLAVLRSLTQLNLLAHLGVACTLTALLLATQKPKRYLQGAVYAAGAFAWMPAFGWVIPFASAEALLAIRLPLLIFTLIVWETGGNRHEPSA